jgi:hypothetical protein
MPTCQGPNCSKQDYENRSETLTRSSSLLFGGSSGRNADATGERAREKGAERDGARGRGHIWRRGHP